MTDVNGRGAAGGEPLSAQGESDEQALGKALAQVRRRGQLVVTERWLVIAGGVLMPLGVVLVLLGWYGAAHTTRLFEEVPYLISGGIFGLALTVAGAACYFGYWLARLVATDRDVLGALLRMEEKVSSGAAAFSVADDGQHAGAAVVTLVATKTGTMYHLPDCPVVRNRSGAVLRTVTAGENGLSPCRICAAPG